MRRFAAGLLLFGLLGAFLPTAGCRSDDVPRNVLIVTLDTTRADRFGCYGFDKASTPNFDRFSGETAMRFENAITAIPLTFPSHTTIMSGTFPVFHGVHDNDGYVLDDGVTTLAEILGRDGFNTAAFVAAFPLDSEFNLNQGFDVYDHDFQADWTEAEKRARTPLSFGFLERKSNLVNRAVKRWLGDNWRDPFFLWVHYFDAHQPYDPPRPYDSQFADSPYDGEIAFMDESFGELLAMLDEKGLRDNTLIVVVGDHGESLGQHGELTHASFLYDPTMRVPLWIAAPNGIHETGRSVRPQVRTVDLAPTILDLLGRAAGQDMQGQSLVPLLEDPEREWSGNALLESHFPWYHFGWGPTRAIRQDRWKYIEAPKPELYDLSADRDEVYNVIGQHPDVAEELAQDLARLAIAAGADPARSTAENVDDETLAKLRALGYVGGGGTRTTMRAERFPKPEALAEMANPLDRSLILEYVNLASEQIRKGQYELAAEAARAGLAIDPSNFRLTVHLGRAQSALRLHRQALETFRAANRINPDAADALLMLGAIHTTLGEHEEAVAALTEAVELNPRSPAILRALGRAYLAQDKLEEAVDIYRTALEQNEADVLACTELAKAYTRLGRSEEARAMFQRAYEREPYSAPLLYNIAVFYNAHGEVAFSRRMLEATLEIAPDHVPANVQLAEQLLDQGEPLDLARPYLERVLERSPQSTWGLRARALLEQGAPPQS